MQPALGTDGKPVWMQRLLGLDPSRDGGASGGSSDEEGQVLHYELESWLHADPYAGMDPWCHGLQADGCSFCVPDTAGAADLDLRAATRWSRPAGGHDVAAGPAACRTAQTGAMSEHRLPSDCL
jgi:hypothetical protein